MPGTRWPSAPSARAAAARQAKASSSGISWPRRDGLHWAYARCTQLPDAPMLARWEKQRALQLERKARAEEKAAEN